MILGEGKSVVKAMRGVKSLKDEEMEQLYGSPPKFSQLDWPKSCLNLNSDKGAHWVFDGFFEKIRIPFISYLLSLPLKTYRSSQKGIP